MPEGLRAVPEDVVGLGVLYGVSDEWHQSFVPGRTAEWGDVRANAIGAACEGAWRTFNLKGEPPITRFSAMILSRDSVLKDAKARAEMGYAPVISVEDGLRGLARG